MVRQAKDSDNRPPFSEESFASKALGDIEPAREMAPRMRPCISASDACNAGRETWVGAKVAIVVSGAR